MTWLPTILAPVLIIFVAALGYAAFSLAERLGKAPRETDRDLRRPAASETWSTGSPH